MARKEPIIAYGVEIRPEEQTPVVEKLLEVLRRLSAEVEFLRGNKKPADKPIVEPSRLNAPSPQPPPKKDKPPRGKPTRAKTKDLILHETKPLKPPNLPAGAVRLGCKEFTVQDLRIELHHTCFPRGRFRLPDGSTVTASLPAGIRGHFGPELRTHVLYPHYQNHVTQPLILEELQELGVQISAGQLSRLLVDGHDLFHPEKDALLPAAREVCTHFHTDDTSARHLGQPAHTTHIGNQFFASFTTTDSKSRLNFLRLLREPFDDFVVGGDACFYLEYDDAPQWLRQRLEADTASGPRIVGGDAAWKEQLQAWGVTSADQQRLVTEAALFGSLMRHDLYTHPPFLSDDAGQFKILGFLHGLCWVHGERGLKRLGPLCDRERQAQERVLTQLWKYYQRLRASCDEPTPQRRGQLDRDFDRLFTQPTGWDEWDVALQRLHGKKAELRLVLEHPELPRHNNLSENDIREFAKKRKISAGTRSENGQRSRDTFISLKKTCRKLAVSFRRFLQDRISGLNELLPLPDLLRRAATHPR